MRVFLILFFGLVLSISCKTTRKSGTLLKVIQTTPEAGVAGVLDKAPLVLEGGKPAVASINKLAGTPPANGKLRLERIVLTLFKSGSYGPCPAKLTNATFTEVVERDIQTPSELQSKPTYRSQDLSMTIEGDGTVGWTLKIESGHDIGDLFLSFDNTEAVTCEATAVGHGYYAVAGTGNWGDGSGDAALDQMIRTWGSDRGHRLWHYLWHGMRSQWEFLEQKDKDALIAFYGATVQPPTRAPQRGPDGEDFLFMHHSMLKAIRSFMTTQGKVMVAPWKVLPRYDDQKFPSTDFAAAQEDFDTWEKDYMDLEKVKAMTLGEYGEAIEGTIHNNMHMRFMNPNDMEIPGDPLDPEWEKKYSKLFDDPAYDYLGGTYSSHVNPVFFMLHGWVDDRIQTWLDAHGFKTVGTEAECAPQNKAEKICYVWLSDELYAKDINRTPWEGVAPSSERTGMGLHSHVTPVGPVPNLSANARALLYKTRKMGGFKKPF